MNYEIITDRAALIDFIDNFLPELNSDETYYCCLFARSKYAKNVDGSNKFPHIKTDKSQLKRFTAKKEHLLNKIEQLECKFGAYKTKDGDPVPQEALALYITPNPRSMRRGLFTLTRKLTDILETAGTGYNIHQEALSAIQKAKSHTHFVDFDIDEELDFDILNSILPSTAYNVLQTRGGYHVLVKPTEATSHNKKWHPQITDKLNVDINGDNMIPVPGTHQGGYTPKFIKL